MRSSSARPSAGCWAGAATRPPASGARKGGVEGAAFLEKGKSGGARFTTPRAGRGVAGRTELADVLVHRAQVLLGGGAHAPPGHRRARLERLHVADPAVLAHRVRVDAQVRRVRRSPGPAPALRSAAEQPILLGDVA